MIVNKNNVRAIIDGLKHKSVLAVDTETTGLRPFHNDRLFSIAICDGVEDYYFNFISYPSIDPNDILALDDIRPLFTPRTWIGHNLKFDIHFLEKEKLMVEGTLHDTMVTARILYNDHMRYSLDECAKRDLGESKDDAVMKYILDNSLYRNETIPGQDKPMKVMFFDKVPLNIIAPYAERDVRLTWRLYEHQMQELSKEVAGPRSLLNIYELESKLLRVCVDMEKRGIKIDREYCEKAVLFEKTRIKNLESEFLEKYGKSFVDSPKELGELFKAEGLEIPITDKGNESIDVSFLERNKSSRLANLLYEHRDATKRCTTYFENYLYFADKDDIIHPSFKQSGTRTGRFSSSDPNLQNIPSEDTGAYPVRRAFIPRKNCFFASLDYQQQELRMMLDYAGEKELISQINAGLDPHQATAELVGIGRKEAKTISFGLIYGMGIQKLANSLLITYEEAKALKYKYFGKLPNTRRLIYGISDRAKERGFITSWLGRRFMFPNSDFAYKSPNALIQGGCADVTKKAMVHIHEALTDQFTQIIMPIHDELILEVEFGDEDILALVKNCMEDAYPYKLIPLTTSMAISLKSLCDADMVEIEGGYIGEEVRNKIQGKSTTLPQGIAANLVREDSTTVH